MVVARDSAWWQTAPRNGGINAKITFHSTSAGCTLLALSCSAPSWSDRRAVQLPNLHISMHGTLTATT